jgi:uncharacterized membrane protein YebE (DUF533 family)
MFDPKSLLDQFLGGQSAGGNAGGFGNMARDAQQKFRNSGMNSFGGGAALGGVLGLLMGGKKMRKMAGGAMGYGGAAVLGALALKAYQNYQQGKSVQAGTGAPAELQQVPPSQLPHALPAADGTPFELLLMRAMIGAAKSDGHVDAQEQQHVFEQVERMGLDSESKAAVFDLLSQPLDLSRLDASIGSEEQRAEIYLAARLATDGSHPGERAYLDALATRLQLPAQLRAHLDSQVSAG